MREEIGRVVVSKRKHCLVESNMAREYNVVGWEVKTTVATVIVRIPKKNTRQQSRC